MASALVLEFLTQEKGEINREKERDSHFELRKELTKGYEEFWDGHIYEEQEIWKLF